MDGKRSISYFHILLNRHEVLLSEGLPSESFFPGSNAMRMLAPTQRAAIFSHFPKLRSDIKQGYGALARQSLTVGETRKLERAGTLFSWALSEKPGLRRGRGLGSGPP
jgi:hypothetical protein